ncbi:MAG TPA: FAD-dependent oxidoreductase, partial [candidate division Zixibacteria bacterium]|nr:FAD-dependent oxidoreductase [candidate division Zixibacteria bacterium]
MAQTADVVIVGGGVIGLASAFYIARERFGGAASGRVVVLEREAVTGAGATGKNAGGIRAQFSTAENILFSLRSIEVFERFKEETGSGLVFHQCGYLFLQTTPEQVARFERQAELQRSLGADVRIMTPSEIKELAPALKVDDVLAGNFFGRDGIADPGDVCMGYYNACKRAGVDVRVGHAVTGIEMVGDTIVSVQTDKGEFATNTVINAAGPYAREIARMVGYGLDVQPVKRQIVTTGALDFIGEDFPMVVDVSSGVYFHRETPGLLMGWAD